MYREKRCSISLQVKYSNNGSVLSTPTTLDRAESSKKRRKNSTTHAPHVLYVSLGCLRTSVAAAWKASPWGQQTHSCERGRIQCGRYAINNAHNLLTMKILPLWSGCIHHREVNDVEKEQQQQRHSQLSKWFQFQTSFETLLKPTPLLQTLLKPTPLLPLCVLGPRAEVPQFHATFKMANPSSFLSPAVAVALLVLAMAAFVGVLYNPHEIRGVVDAIWASVVPAITDTRILMIAQLWQLYLTNKGIAALQKGIAALQKEQKEGIAALQKEQKEGIEALAALINGTAKIDELSDGGGGASNQESETGTDTAGACLPSEQVLDTVKSVGAVAGACVSGLAAGAGLGS